jgi:hypothetical protein
VQAVADRVVTTTPLAVMVTTLLSPPLLVGMMAQADTTKDKEREVINMYEYYIESIYTGEERVVYGYNVKDAFRRANLAPIEWGIIYAGYVD